MVAHGELVCVGIFWELWRCIEMAIKSPKIRVRCIKNVGCGEIKLVRI